MRYDPRWDALIHPEQDGPLFDRPLPWNEDGRCAELSRLAYIRFEGDDLPRLTHYLDLGGFGAPAWFSDAGTDAQGFGTRHADGSAWLAYRGTEPRRLRSIISDLDFLPGSWPGGGRVHRGFAAAERSVATEVDAWVETLGGRSFIVTGHSLGAAMATLTAARFPQSRLVVFGSPRVGNDEFRRRFAGRTVRRYVDCRDIVDDIVPSALYSHLDGEQYIDRLGNVRDRPPGFVFRALDQFRANRDYLPYAIRPGNAPARELADHTPLNYISAVLGVREGP